MAPQAPRLTVRYGRSVDNALKQIWDHNASGRGTNHAEAYESFLRRTILTLAQDYNRGTIVQQSPGLRYIVARLKLRGAGHVIIYEVDQKAKLVRILRLFHPKQDWQNSP